MVAPRLIEAVASTTSHRDRDELDAALARLLFDFVQAQRITMYRVLDDGEPQGGQRRVQRRVALARDGADLGPQDGSDPTLLPRVVDHLPWRECVLLQDIVHYETADAPGLRSLFPVRSGDCVVGMLEIEAGDGLDPREAGLVHGILRIMRNHLSLLDYGERDTLTGLLNRKTYEASFGRLRQRAVRLAGAEPGWLGVVDIDHFKSVNDTYGHLFGDEVLLLVSRLMRESFRGADHLYRFGGEEFVIVLDRAGSAGAQLAFDRLRMRIAEYAFPQVGQVTVSLGFTEVLPADTPAAAFERADAALYYAKHHGRNQVHCYEALLAAGAVQSKAARGDVELF